MSTSSPSSSPPPPSLPHSPPSNRETQTTKKSQPYPWTHKETVHLIRAYQEKWYSLKRGQLKASQWEEVADTVASRCGYGYSHPEKSSIQCRHKMEKLRRRYRDEKRLFSLGGSSSWPYFDLMDSLECGPLTIPAIPLVPMPSVYKNNNKNHVSGGAGYYGGGSDGDEEVEEEEEDYGYRNRSKSRSINYILRKPSMVNRFAGSEREAVKKRKKREEMLVVAAEHEEEGKEMELRLAAEIRGFAERMEGMERKKMEMVRQTERRRMEMEKKRTEMILDSQRKIVDMIVSAGAFGGSQL